MKITIYTLASDDDYGTRANVYATEREAVLGLIASLKGIPSDEESHELVRNYFDPDAETDFYESIREFKSDYDTYSIEEHTLEYFPPDSPEMKEAQENYQRLWETPNTHPW